VAAANSVPALLPSRVLPLFLLCALVLASPAPARATPATADEAAAMRVEAARSRIDDVRERTLRAKARLFLLGAAMTGTRSYAKTPQEAIANADKATKAAEAAPRTPRLDKTSPPMTAALVR